MQNFMKTIINAVQSWTKKEIKEEIKKIPIVHPDWNENDNNSPNYIKNRPFYEGEVVIFDDIIEIETGQYGSTEGYSDKIIDLEVGETYTIYWDNIKYTSVGEDYDAETVLGFNNGINISDSFGNYPVHVYNAPLGTHTLKITKHGYNKIDEKFLPEKLNKENPSGTGSFSMNRRSDTTIGNYSVVLGLGNTASSTFSAAIGENNTVSGPRSTAIGNSNQVSGSFSFAVGHKNNISGNYSTAIGYENKNSSNYSFVEGKHNIEDLAGKYAHIIGNGTASNVRSNAHTLDWNGVGWFQGGLQVGGNAQDDGAKNVMLEGNAYDYFILNDVSTGTPYKIQIIDGNLVSSVMTNETESTT